MTQIEMRDRLFIMKAHIDYMLEQTAALPDVPSAPPAPVQPAYRWATYKAWCDDKGLLCDHVHRDVFTAARELAPADMKFNCPPFCPKCGKCHDKGPCPVPVPAKPEPDLDVGEGYEQAGAAQREITREGMVPCESCGDGVFVSWKFCPRCGTARHQ